MQPEDRVRIATSVWSPRPTLLKILHPTRRRRRAQSKIPLASLRNLCKKVQSGQVARKARAKSRRAFFMPHSPSSPLGRAGVTRRLQTGGSSKRHEPRTTMTIGADRDVPASSCSNPCYFSGYPLLFTCHFRQISRFDGLFCTVIVFPPPFTGIYRVDCCGLDCPPWLRHEN